MVRGAARDRLGVLRLRWIYPERPAAVARQVLADLCVGGWTTLWIRAAVWLHDLVDRLATPGEQLERLADSLSVNLDATSRAIGGVPLVGDSVAGPLERAAGSAHTIAGAARQQQDWAHSSASTAALILVVVPLGLVLFVWLPRRVRRSRRIAVCAELRTTAAGLDLLAARAMARQPLTRLARGYPDLASGWRRGDPSAVATLAAWELRAAGLRPAVEYPDVLRCGRASATLPQDRPDSGLTPDSGLLPCPEVLPRPDVDPHSELLPHRDLPAAVDPWATT